MVQMAPRPQQKVVADNQRQIHDLSHSRKKPWSATTQVWVVEKLDPAPSKTGILPNEPNKSFIINNTGSRTDSYALVQ